MIATGRVSWFSLDKKFGFVALDGAGDAFLHMAVLKSAGYGSVPAGTTMRVRVQDGDGRRRVVEVLEVDISTGKPGEPAAIPRKSSGEP